jgi:serine/threonine protein kinase
VALTPGSRLGPYEIVSPLGVGGMGEVYRASDSRLKRQVAVKIMVVPYVADNDTFTAEKPHLWSEGRFQTRGPNIRMFDLHPDGKRFVLALSEDMGLQGKQNHLTVVFNFFDELRRRAPASL